MRKVVAGLFMSLDGVVETPEKWGFQYFTEGLNEIIAKGLAEADTVLLGPGTYHKFAQIWPSQGDSVPMARFLNKSPKYVISDDPNFVDKLEWQPATQLKGTLTEEIKKLKAQSGKNIQVPGSPRLVRSLLAEGLLDELSLSICPIVVGSGLKLFDDMPETIKLKVAHSQVFENGLVSMTYRPIVLDSKSNRELDFPDAAQAPSKPS
jgi:dihydrofolate reductase